MALTNPCLVLSWQGETCKCAAFGNRLMVALCRGWYSELGSNFCKLESGIPILNRKCSSEHLPSLPLQHHIRQHPWSSLCLPPAQMFSFRHTWEPLLLHSAQCGCLTTLTDSLDMHISSGLHQAFRFIPF